MALRSLVRKLPALGVRSRPTPPLMGPVHKLSPAAGSRLFSTDLPSAEEGQIVSSREEILSGQREKINRMRAHYRQTLKVVQRDIDELCRGDAEDFEMLRKEHEKIHRACNAFLLLCVPVTILTYLYSS